jgi:hypothetical protein
LKEKIVKKNLTMYISGLTLLATLAITVQLSAQDNPYYHPRIITFDAPDAGRGPGQGTLAFAIGRSGVVMGEYIDASTVIHGFLRSREGTVTSFDAPGAGVGPGQGTQPFSINPEGVITGYYTDSSGLSHGFVRARDRDFITFDAPGAGIPAGTPCSPLLIANTGTQGASINLEGAVAGQYVDASGVFHGFLRSPEGTITTFDGPGAGTGLGQGTFVTFGDGINPEGAITGGYADVNCGFHGLIRAPDGTFTTFDPPGSVFTDNAGINAEGTVMGFYLDASFAFHGYVRAPNGTLHLVDVSGAGTGPFQGTEPFNINARGDVVGPYVDGNGVNHGFLRLKEKDEDRLKNASTVPTEILNIPDDILQDLLDKAHCRGGAITTFDAPGAGTGSGQGTIPVFNSSADAITGFYVDANGVSHGFLRTAVLRNDE